MATSSPFPCASQLLVELRLCRFELGAASDQLLLAHQPRVVVLAHAAGITVDDVLDAGALFRDLQHLVDLLLILGDDDLRPGVVDQVSDLLIEGILVDAEDHRPKGVRGDLAVDPLGAVVADNADRVAAADAEGVHPQGKPLDAGVVVGPGEFVPDAELLLAQRHPLWPVRRVVGEQLGKGVEPGDIGIVRGRTAH